MVACGWGGRYALYAEQLPETAFTAPRAVRAGSGPWYFLDVRADLGGGNRTASDTPDSDDSRTVSRTSIREDTSKEDEQTELVANLMTMSQIPDVNRELAEVGAMFEVFRAVKGEPPSS